MVVRTVLVVDDDAAVRDALAQTLELGGLVPRVAGSFVEAKDQIGPGFPGVILSDIRMPGRDGFHLLDYARAADPDLPVILLTGEGDIPMAVKAMGQGAFGFLEKPCAGADLLKELERALKTRALVLENRVLKAQLTAGDPAARLVHGISALAEGVRARVRAVAATRGEVLVTGAPGTGISKIAEVVHLMGPDAKGPFIKRAAAGMDAAAVMAALDAARGGSLFLDEVGHLGPEAQFAMMEALEAGTAVRVIAGSNLDLAEKLAAGQFHADLFYRLDVMRIRLPSLSERPEDIPVLFEHYVAQASEQAGLLPPQITPDVVAGLMARDWPGNARALMSVAMQFALGLGGAEEATSEPGLAAQMAQVERSLLGAALRHAGGRAAEAAERLQLPRKTFYDKLSRYGLKPEDFR